MCICYPKCFRISGFVLFVSLILFPGLSAGQGDGLLMRDGVSVFPLGSYDLPSDEAELEAMVEAGFNLFGCRNEQDLDRVEDHGVYGWVRLRMEDGATDALREQVESLKDHPALAVWHGPDEFVWHLSSGASHLADAGLERQDWWTLDERALEHAEEHIEERMPRLIEGIEHVRATDDGKHQIWFNEARQSDLQYTRQYIDYIDITGADDYPVKPRHRYINRVGPGVSRWLEVGKGRPVWYVLQAFAWDELDDPDVDEPTYPSFSESRHMAYSSLTHGASGLLYWGSHRMQSEEFEQFQAALFSLVSEIDQLQPFLTAPELAQVSVRDVPEIPDGEDRSTAIKRELDPGVSHMARRFGRDWIIVLVNEHDDPKMGVEVRGLDHLNGEELKLLYGSEELEVRSGRIVTRLRPLEVKVFATDRKWESEDQQGRDYPGTGFDAE